jgi:hypothetical protein
MFTGKEILVAVVSTVITFGIMLAIIKRLSSTLLDFLRETLLELKNNDIKLFEKTENLDKDIIGIKKDIEHLEEKKSGD